MALSAQKRARTRKHLDAPEPSEPEEVDALTTPGRKRRRINNQQNTESPSATIGPSSRQVTASGRRKTRSSDIKVYEDDSSFNEEDPENIIRNLRQAKYQVAARFDYANEAHEVNNPQGKQAYGKIAGNGWTFYVDELEVRIGRPPEERQSEGPQSGGDSTSVDKSLVHIDLGPSKLVSRLHAEIRFDEASGQWCLAVNGRNGARVDDAPLNRGDVTTLRSGSIVEVAGTEMMFVTPNEEPQVDPAVIARYKAHRGEDDEDEDDLHLMQPPSLPHRTPTKGPHSGLANGRNASSSQHASSNNHSGRRYGERTAAPSALVQTDGSADSAVPSSQQNSKDSPTYPRGLMLETTKDIDYSQDSAKDLKPPHSYAQLIGMAILSSPEEKLTLANIYTWIKDRYAYYRFSGGGWQNSIRHNLSLNKNFEKVARRTDEPGKGMKWQIMAESRDEFLKKGLGKKMTRSSSGPSSPAPTKGVPSSTDPDIRSDNHFLRDFNDLRGKGKIEFKTSPGSTPPMSHFPQAKQAFTPDRGSNIFSKLHGPETSSPRNGVIGGLSPFPYSALRDSKSNGLTEAAAAGSPGGPRISLNSDANDHFFTPLITRHAPKLAPPSTARLPSQFMPMSSPAPFWKYADFGSTPAKAETSPVKGFKRESGIVAGSHKQDTKEDGPDHKTWGVHSSSPPLPDAEVGRGSPSKGSGLRRQSTTELPLPTQQSARQRSPSKMPLASVSTSQRPTQHHAPVDTADEETDEGGGVFDLAR
ncbi:MAG: transcription factor [Chrysothrix sp. TS-e1954]|nr:MAG: transcription factor [Chrysothrix sp. TS-e1954]